VAEIPETDVVVVGAGLAGLIAARRLSAAGASVVVVEARDRVGGRSLSRELAGDVIDLGGQWAGAGDRRLLALAAELGVRSFPQHHQGRKVLEVDGKVSTYRAVPSLPLLGLLETGAVVARLERLRRRVPLDRPHETPGAAALDAITVEDWKREHVRTAGARAALDVAVRAIFAAEPRELSFLHFLFYLNSGGGILRLATIPRGAQQARFVGGAQSFSIRIAAALGDRVLLGRPVRAIEQDGEGVTVRADGGEPIRARWGVVAVPPALAAKIDFRPGLPSRRATLASRMPMGSVTKCIVAYERAFWRERGLSGEVASTGGPVRLIFDDTSHDGAHPALVAFLVGDSAREMRGRPEERRRAVLDAVTRYLGPEGRAPIDYVDQDWAEEPWSAGCYVGLMPPGLLSTCGGALREPCGRIHWAGTETAIEGNGYFEGAIESGERVAVELQARRSASGEAGRRAAAVSR
jgi:monoamine oxidase